MDAEPIPTGLLDVDAHLDGGLPQGELMVLHGEGASMLGMNIAEHVAMDAKLATGVLSVDADSFRENLSRSRARVAQGALIGNSEHQRLERIAARIDQAPLFMWDISQDDWQRDARRLVKISQCKLLIIQGDGLKLSPTAIPQLRELALELNVALLLCARTLPESSNSFAEHADVVGYISLPPLEDEDDVVPAELALFGAEVDETLVPLTFLPKFGRFENSYPTGRPG